MGPQGGTLARLQPGPIPVAGLERIAALCSALVGAAGERGDLAVFATAPEPALEAWPFAGRRLRPVRAVAPSCRTGALLAIPVLSRSGRGSRSMPLEVGPFPRRRTL